MAHKDDRLKTHTRNHYARLFDRGCASALPIQTGRNLAEALGYPVASLDSVITGTYWNCFVPCGNPIPHLQVRPGDRILNLGCGGAIDSFAITARYDASVEIVNMDVVFSVLARAEIYARRSPPLQYGRFHWICGDAENLPFRKGAFDRLFMNGVFNLLPNKAQTLGEIRRVLEPEGSLVITDLCAAGPLPDYFQDEPDAWAWCMTGACTEKELIGLLESSGFHSIRLIREEPGDMFHRIVLTGRGKP